MKSQALHNFSLPDLKWNSAGPRNRRQDSGGDQKAEEEAKKPWMLRSQRQTGIDGNSSSKKKLWISLSRGEIEEDLYAFTGAKSSRRPKKLPNNLKKQLDRVFPGLSLVGVSPDSYVLRKIRY